MADDTVAPTPKSVEIYIQRYETFRHLDKLRWQMLQLLIAVASATALVRRSIPGELEWWFYALLGAALATLAFVMLRIGGGIRTNSIALREAGNAIGDSSLPDVSNKWKSVAHWLAIVVLILGLAMMAIAVFASGVFQ
ncbi:MAG: hypothetical protein AAF967_14040 [Pseudomonadota bacterium]